MNHYVFLFIESFLKNPFSSIFICFRPPEIQLLSRRTGAVLTRKMDTYKEGFLTKVASNHTKWWDYHSKWLSRLTCPPQIQLQSRRTGAILIRRIDTYKEVVLTKVASNHTNWWFYLSEWSSRFTCPPQIQPKSRRTGAVLTRRMDTYNEVVLTKVASNHTVWWYDHSKWTSILSDSSINWYDLKQLLSRQLFCKCPFS